MSGKGKRTVDRRVLRTRTALVGAFGRLFLGRRRGAIRVDEIAAEANVGRSTFYEHFSGADALALEAMKRPIAALADAAAGRGDPEALEAMLTHYWENRVRGRELLTGRAGDRTARLLGEMVEERLQDTRLSLPPRLAASMCAGAAVALLRPWLSGEGSAPPRELASAICRGGTALRSALEPAQVQSAR